MRTLVFTIFASLLLLLHATAEAYWKPPMWPPDVTQPYYWGDVLNITKCYCGDKVDAAYYYQFDYRNFHNKQDYTLGWTCESNFTIDGWGTVSGKRTNFVLPFCWNPHALWRKHKRKECNTSYNGDTFCYELGNTHDPVDHYFFNGHKRKLPVKGVTDFSPDQCAPLCRVKFHGKDIASDTEGGWEKSLPSREKPLMALKSSFQMFTDLDDITANHKDTSS
ncbi:hypothetical protein BDR22DRAFT_875661 [Usnea florida]